MQLIPFIYFKYAGTDCEKIIFVVLSDVIWALTTENWNYRMQVGLGCYLPFCMISYFQLSLCYSKQDLIGTVLLMSWWN